MHSKTNMFPVAQTNYIQGNVHRIHPQCRIQLHCLQTQSHYWCYPFSQLGFAGIKSWTALIQKFGKLKQSFTRQENTVIQTCVVASSGIAFSSGTASYMLGMSPYIASQADAGNLPINTKNLAITWMLPYLLVVSFAGLFSIVALRKMMIMKYKLTYPSGTATAYLINCFHTPKCLAIPFYLGGYFAIDMCLGSLILFGWQMYNKQKAKDFGPAVASGLICGDSLWGIPASVLALAGVKAPFCMKF
ncbi:hypothetical protein MTR67_024196 [Solanum verrucosum]|uniref:Uncharacterized protein n=1 Tax=Solanum verrucosum TaxID=315347 RepID=A0AAF0QWK3_SOLVR|nr:hypothetical protein MTR67_024196 [Solanum verrucosum]